MGKHVVDSAVIVVNDTSRGHVCSLRGDFIQSDLRDLAL
jgi:hypothetical protein